MRSANWGQSDCCPHRRPSTLRDTVVNRVWTREEVLRILRQWSPGKKSEEHTKCQHLNWTSFTHSQSFILEIGAMGFSSFEGMWVSKCLCPCTWHTQKVRSEGHSHQSWMVNVQTLGCFVSSICPVSGPLVGKLAWTPSAGTGTSESRLQGPCEVKMWGGQMWLVESV